jgi:hypothetical protein
MVRIRKTRWKVAYIAGSVLLVLGANILVLPRVLPDPLAAVSAQVLVVARYFAGIRSFRGQRRRQHRLSPDPAR